MDKNVTDYDTIESKTTGTCYSEHREYQIQVLLRWYARWEKTTENCVIWFIQGLTRYIPVTTKTQLSDNVSVCTPLHLTPHMQWISAVYSPGCQQSQSQSHRDGPPVGPGPAPQPPSDRPRSSPCPPARIDRTLCVVESDWRWQSPGLYKTNTEYNIHYHLTTCHCDRLEKCIYPYLYNVCNCPLDSKFTFISFQWILWNH